MKRPVGKLLDDIIQAAEIADEIVRRGRANFESDPVAQFGAEAAVGRIGDAASKLPEKVRASMPDIPWKEIVGFRIGVDHAYHRLDYARLEHAVPGRSQAPCGDRTVSRLIAATERSGSFPKKIHGPGRPTRP
jgi:uncharacterized protein with HEPN domain